MRGTYFSSFRARPDRSWWATHPHVPSGLKQQGRGFVQALPSSAATCTLLCASPSLHSSQNTCKQYPCNTTVLCFKSTMPETQVPGSPVPVSCGPSSKNVDLFMCCKLEGNADLRMQWNFYYNITAIVLTDFVEESCTKGKVSGHQDLFLSQ